jgi:hypothetical protein
VAEDVAVFVAESGKLDAAISLSALALELREKIVADCGDHGGHKHGGALQVESS